MCNFPNRYVLTETLEGNKTYILAEAPIEPSGVGIEPSGLLDKIAEMISDDWEGLGFSYPSSARQRAGEILAVLGIEPTGVGIEPSGWRPIETAPRDGMYVILAGCGPRPVIAQWHHAYWEWQSDKGSSVYLGPTHWQPLPPPPLT